MKTILLKLIQWYQDRGGGSELLGIDCCFSPTCSQYTKEAVIKYGLVKGGFMGVKRIHRCRDYGSRCVCVDPVN